MAFVDRCAGCPFGPERPGVGHRGSLEAPVVLVGESLGREEMIHGFCFAGESGELLQSIVPVSLDDPSVLVLNALRCFPVNKDQTNLRKGVIACRQRLLQEVGLHPRKVIIALGAGALWSLTDNFYMKITQERGKIFDTPLAEKGIVASVHPAYLLRGGGSLRQLREDILKGFDLNGDIAPPPSVDISCEIARTPKEIATAISILLNQPLLVADTETTGLDCLTDRILAFGIAYEEDKVIIFSKEVFEDPDLRLLLRPLFDDSRPIWVWHNGKFDIGFLREVELQARVDGDTMLMSYARDENKGIHDLEQLGNDLLGIPPYKHMALRYLTEKGDTFEKIPEPVLYEYLAKDCSSTFRTYKVLSQRMSRDKYLPRLCKETLVPSSEFYYHLERRGMFVDREILKGNKTRLSQEIKDRGAHLDTIAGRSINPNSWQQVSQLLYNDLNLRHPRRAKVRDTRKETLEKLRPLHPVTKAVRDCRKSGKALSTYIVGTEDKIKPDGRVHSSILIHGTTTGRPASRKPNILNIPRDPRLRGMYRAPKGYVLLDADADQAELRTLAMLSGDEYLTAVYMDGTRKLHAEMSVFLFGEGYTDSQYMRAKAVNFGIPYGREAFSLAEEFDTTETITRNWIATWFEQAKGAYEFLKWCRKSPEEGRTLITRFGRKRRFGVVSRENLKHLKNEAANFPVQSTSSDIVLHTGMRARPELAKIGVHIINFVYDNLLNECPAEVGVVEEAKQIIERHLQEVVDNFLDTKIPFVMSYKLTTHWGNPETAVDLVA